MSSGETYNLLDLWRAEDWPYDATPEGIKTINKVAGPLRHYALVSDSEGVRIDLYEYDVMPDTDE